ncbi:MAG: 30S ribosomal protein S1 [Bryobacterales bacterium]|nr:30S ribosomal protein S1 [Bryobacterales bacterium]
MAQQSLDRDDPVAATPETGSSFGDILQAYEHSRQQRPDPAGDGGREGTVVAVSPDSVFVDIGYKTEGIIPAADFRDDAGNVDVRVGDMVQVSITGRDSEGYYRLSKIRVRRPRDWSALEKAFQEKTAIGGVVSGQIKGGFSVDIGVRAFMPASRSGARDAAEMEKLVGQEIACRIIKLDTQSEDVVVDRRVVLEEEEKRAREARYSELKEGEVLRGTVRTLTDYGAFVDIGGVDGLLHVADISWGRVNKPADVLSVGDSVDVQVLKVDPNKRRISLGMKQLAPDPWTTAGEKYSVGQRVCGAVTRVTDFGAFVELEPGLEGLIHLTELSWSKKVRKPSDVVKPGDSVEVMVLGVSTAERRVSLGLKQALGDPWEQAKTRFPVGSVVEGPVRNMTKFGAWVELGEGIEGMIHVSDMSAEKHVGHPKEVVKEGQAVRAQVLELDVNRRRIRLGLKQLQPTTVDEYISEHREGDLVTGRVADVSKGKARVELGQGIQALCKVPEERAETASESASEGKPDITLLGQLLSSKWKTGQVVGMPSGKREPARAGQVRSFRITRLDPAEKKIELELLA